MSHHEGHNHEGQHHNHHGHGGDHPHHQGPRSPIHPAWFYAVGVVLLLLVVLVWTMFN